MPCPYPEWQITFLECLDCETAAPGRLWPCHRRLVTAWGPAALGIAPSQARGTLGGSGLPVPPALRVRRARLPTLQGAPSARGRRATRQRSLCASRPLPSPGRALGAPGTARRRRGTPAWPREVARESSGAPALGAFPLEPLQLVPNTPNSAPSRSRGPPSFAELGRPASCRQCPEPTSPRVAKVGPRRRPASRSRQQDPRPRRARERLREARGGKKGTYLATG